MKPSSADTLKLASFNIRVSGLHPVVIDKTVERRNEERPWVERRDGLVDQIIWEEPDIIGFQEVSNGQRQDLTALLGPLYCHVGVGRRDGKMAGEAVPIFWRTDRLRLISADHFWLSERPEVVGSIGWDAALPRVATLAHFSFLTTNHSSGDRDNFPSLTESQQMPEDFFVLNTHYDHHGALSRKRSSELILARLSKLMDEKGAHGAYGKLVVILGDLNSPPGEDGYRVLTDNRYIDYEPKLSVTPPFLTSNATSVTFLDSCHALLNRKSSSGTTSVIPNSNPPRLHSPFGEQFTYTSFSPGTDRQLIDYILLADNGAVKVEGGSEEGMQWRVEKFGVIPNRYGDGNCVSDHRMVLVTLRKG